MRIYISGPITGTDDYYERFMNAKMEIKESGNEAINPAPLGYVLPESSSHADFMKLCLPLVEMADCIYMLRGWQQSLGARAEMECAISHGKTIIFEQ